MELTPQEERFAQEVVRLNNQSAAYRAAYNCANANFRTIGTEAADVAGRAHVSARIRELRDRAAAETAIPSAAQRIAELREIEAADATLISGVRLCACRHCHGFDHGYQWIDEIEYARAVDTAIATKMPHPEMSGGFGFNPTLDPHASCPRCWGIGEQRAYVADVSKLTGAVRRLYKGIKVKGNGDIEILLHDQLKARDMLNRIQGIYKDVLVVPGATAGAVAQATEAKTPEERQRSYLQLVSAV